MVHLLHRRRRNARLRNGADSGEVLGTQACVHTPVLMFSLLFSLVSDNGHSHRRTRGLFRVTSKPGIDPQLTKTALCMNWRSVVKRWPQIFARKTSSIMTSYNETSGQSSEGRTYRPGCCSGITYEMATSRHLIGFGPSKLEMEDRLTARCKGSLAVFRTDKNPSRSS